MEERSFSLAYPGKLTLRFAVAGQHARAFLECTKQAFGPNVGGESWSDGGLDVLDINLDLNVGPRRVALAIHGLSSPATYSLDPERLVASYGGIVFVAGPRDSAHLVELGSAFARQNLPVWSAPRGVAIRLPPGGAIEADEMFECRPDNVRLAMKDLTREALSRLRSLVAQ